MRIISRLTFILLSLLIFISNDLNAQKVKDFEDITPYLDSMGLDFYFPTENQLKFSSPRKNQFFDYDARIKIKSNGMEVLVDFYPVNESSFSALHPHLEFNRLLANLVPNDDDQEVLVIGWREPKLNEKNADWGAEAYMKARKEITSFPFTKLVSFYKENYGMVVILYCFNKPDSVPELMAFKKGI
jgi:hypothetical protein